MALNKYIFGDIFHPSILNTEFFSQVVKNIHPAAQVMSWKHSPLDSADGILSSVLDKLTLEKPDLSNFVGFCKFDIDYAINGSTHKKSIVIKSKATPEVMTSTFRQLTSAGGSQIQEAFEDFLDGDITIREIEVYRVQEPQIKAILPEIYITVSDETKGIYLVVMEYMDQNKFQLLKTVGKPECWTDESIKEVLSGLAYMHALYLNKVEKIPSDLQIHLENKITPNYNKRVQLIKLLVDHNLTKGREYIPENLITILKAGFDKIEMFLDILSECPMTLVHFDCETRNLCLRKSPSNLERSLCLYDWELCAIDVPQRDVIIFIASLLPETEVTWQNYAEWYRKCLVEEIHSRGPVDRRTDEFLEPTNFHYMFKLCAIHTLLDLYMISVYFLVVCYNDEFHKKMMKSVANYIASFASEFNLDA